jgi:hypothetical protein
MLTTACSIKDKEGQLARDYVAKGDDETENAFRRSQVQQSFSKDDVASGASEIRTVPSSSEADLHTDDDDDFEGSGSESE